MREPKNKREILSEEERRSAIARKTFMVWDSFLSWVFKEQSRCYSSEADPKHYTMECPAYRSFVMQHARYGPRRGIICCVTQHSEDIRATRELLRKIYDHCSDAFQLSVTVAEVMTKILAYRVLNKRQSFLLPIATSHHSTACIRYRVDIVFDLWKDVTAYGLLPQKAEAAPILLFRGTDLSMLSSSGRASMLSDFDPQGPGVSLFKHAQETLRSWLKQVTTRKQKARVMGHSLGGALTCYTCLFLPEYLSQQKHEPSFAINYPGIQELFLEQWQALPLEKKPNFIGIVTKGDIVSKFGQLLDTTYQIGCDTVEPPLFSHEMLVTSYPQFHLQQVATDKENAASSRALLTKLQKHSSKILYEIGLKKLLPEEKHG